MVNSCVIRSLAAAVLFVATGAVATADAAEWAGQTPRATVKLGGLAVAMNDGTDVRETTTDNRNRAINDSVAQNTNTNINTNTNTAANTNTNASSSSNTNDNSSEANADASAAANVAGGSSGGGSASASVDGDEDATSSAAPIFLSTGDDTCMGSSGVGVQGMEFGFSVGSSWTDENCIMLKNARELKNQGHDKAAKARLCMNDENALAFELAGEPCPRALPSTQAALAKLREWNPDYQAAAAPGPQVASTAAVPAPSGDAPAPSGDASVSADTSAGASATMSAGPADTDAEWLSPKIEGFLAMVSSALDHLTSGAGGLDFGGDGMTAMDGLE